MPFLSSINNIVRCSRFNSQCELNQHFIFARVIRSLIFAIVNRLYYKTAIEIFFRHRSARKFCKSRKIVYAIVFGKQEDFSTSF